MEIQRIIEDSSLSTEAKVILLSAEMEKILRTAPLEEVEVKLLCDETVFIPTILSIFHVWVN